jgi:beta-xylosidase
MPSILPSTLLTVLEKPVNKTAIRTNVVSSLGVNPIHFHEYSTSTTEQRMAHGKVYLLAMYTAKGQFANAICFPSIV